MHERAANRIGIFLQDAAGTQSVVPGGFDLSLHVVGDLLGLGAFEQKSGGLRKYVLRIGVAP